MINNSKYILRCIWLIINNSKCCVALLSSGNIAVLELSHVLLDTLLVNEHTDRRDFHYILCCCKNGSHFYRAACNAAAVWRGDFCPSVCLSVTRVDCDKTVERSVQIYIPYERTFILVF